MCLETLLSNYNKKEKKTIYDMSNNKDALLCNEVLEWMNGLWIFTSSIVRSFVHNTCTTLTAVHEKMVGCQF